MDEHYTAQLNDSIEYLRQRLRSANDLEQVNKIREELAEAEKRRDSVKTLLG